VAGSAIEGDPANFIPVLHLIKIYEHTGCGGQAEMLTDDLESLYKALSIGVKLTQGYKHY